MNTASVEIEIGGQQLRMTANWSLGDPGRTSGPPERCYPAEPPEWEVVRVELLCVGVDTGWRWLDITDLVEELGGNEMVDQKSYDQFEMDGGFDEGDGPEGDEE